MNSRFIRAANSRFIRTANSPFIPRVLKTVGIAAGCVMLYPVFLYHRLSQSDQRFFKALIGKPVGDGNLTEYPQKSSPYPYDGKSWVHHTHIQYAIDQKDMGAVTELWNHRLFGDKYRCVKWIFMDYAAHQFPNAKDRIPMVWGISRLRL